MKKLFVIKTLDEVMPNPIFSDTTNFFKELCDKYSIASRNFAMEYSTQDRIAQQRPNATEDFTYIYELISRFGKLKEGIDTAITEYQSSRFKSKKDINAFVESLAPYCNFFGGILGSFNKKIAEIMAAEEEARAGIAFVAPLNACASQARSHGNLQTETNNILKNQTDRFNTLCLTLAYLIPQKHSLYAFSKVALLSYEMLSEIMSICQRVKKKDVRLLQVDFAQIDSWMTRYEEERKTEGQVAISSVTHHFEGLRKRIDEYNKHYTNIRVTPLARYNSDNRILDLLPRANPAPAAISIKKETQVSAPPVSSLPPSSQVVQANSARPYVSRTFNWANVSQAYHDAVEKLKIKTTQLVEEAKTNSSYVVVAGVTLNLIVKLESAPTIFKNPQRVTQAEMESFKNLCKGAINDVRGEFEHHRSLLEQLHPVLKAILGVLAAITIIPAIVVEATSKHGYIGTFFNQYPTDSIDKLNTFEAEVGSVQALMQGPY